jgi:lactate dehydrogenase-like 2-hydroxyacid dehydrogenase
MRQSAVTLTNYQRIFAPCITETAIGLLLCLTSGIAKYYMPQFYKHRTLQPLSAAKSPHHTELVGRTMGIVGMGRIGTALARRAHYGFDTRIVATDAKPIGKPDFVDALHDPRFSKAQMTAFPQEPLGIWPRTNCTANVIA